MYRAWYMHGIHQCYAWNMHEICLYHACYTHEIRQYYAWNMPVLCMVKCMHVSDLYHACPLPVKRLNSLHVPVLSHETCMVHAHYALQDHAISMHETMRDVAHGMC